MGKSGSNVKGFNNPWNNFCGRPRWCLSCLTTATVAMVTVVMETVVKDARTLAMSTSEFELSLSFLCSIFT